MSEKKKANLSATKTGSRKVIGNKFTTKSGKTIRVNKSLNEKSKARRDAKALRKSERNKGLPKGRAKRFVYKLHPKRLYAYWFSRDGASTAVKVLGFSIVIGFFLLI